MKSCNPEIRRRRSRDFGIEELCWHLGFWDLRTPKKNYFSGILVLVLVDVGHGVYLELRLPHSLSSLFLNALTDSDVTTDSVVCSKARPLSG